jgi:hypothetical protein
MATTKEIEKFLSAYNQQVCSYALELRKVLLATLPGILEQIDASAKIIAYCYGQKYTDLICVIIPSKAGLKLGFNRGAQISDPEHLLEGKGKVSRYVPIKSIEQINTDCLRDLLINALALYSK